MKTTLLDVIHQLAAQAQQIDPNQGTKAAQQGAVQRLAEPTYYDYIFPALAFILVIILPLVTVGWVMWKTVTEKKIEPDET